MILLTGATGLVGGELLPLLLSEGHDVRVLVRDPRRLGANRVNVRISLGDLADPFSMRHALRGVDTVIHLAATIRDQPAGSIEELNGLATCRLLRSSERVGVERFVFFSAMNANDFQRTRFFQAKALAESAVLDAELNGIVMAPSIVYGLGDPWITLLERLSMLPAMPISGNGNALYQPIWARDVARCVAGALNGRPENGGEPKGENGAGRRYELAGPQVLSYEGIVGEVLEVLGRSRPLVHVPLPAVRAGLWALELLEGADTFATWDEVELMEVPMTSARGTEDVEGLGVEPHSMQAVLSGAGR